MSVLYFPAFGGRVRVNIFAPACFWIIAVSEGVPAFFCVLAGALVHEAGHLILIYSHGQKVTRIDIEPFGGTIGYTSEGLGYNEEASICAAGIFFNLLFAFLGCLPLGVLRSEYLLLFIFSCLFFAFINIIPLKTNDGGHLIYLRTAKNKGEEAAEKALKTASVIGGVILAALGIFILYLSDFNNGMCVLFILAAIPK